MTSRAGLRDIALPRSVSDLLLDATETNDTDPALKHAGSWFRLQFDRDEPQIELAW